MELGFSPTGWQDYVYWQTTDKAMLRKINKLITECLRTPYEGTGKPEMLRYDLAGYWSRRIDHEHRLVYTVRDNRLIIASCRYHYEK